MSRRSLANYVIGLALALVVGAGGVFGASIPYTQAQVTSDSLDVVGEQTGLGTEDPRIIVAKLINTGLTVLGVIVVLIVIYGGFVWMTAQGNPEQVDKAKKILINATIGLFIILASWGITSFVIRSLLDATDGGTSTDGGGGGSGGGLGGGGRSTSFTIEDYSPEGEVVIRNIVYRITFSHSVDEATVADNISITNATTGDAVTGTFDVSSNSVAFTPTATCPDPNTDRFCFDENTTFTVEVSSDVESSSGKSLQCSTDAPCTSTFTSGSLVDVEDPTAEFSYPDDGDGVPSDSLATLQVSATDDTQLSASDFSLDDETFDSVSAPDDAGTTVIFETLWDTVGLEDGERYKVLATVTDIAGNSTEDSIRVVARPATCFNGVLDSDLGEEDIDCGGDSSSSAYCGACDGGSCTEDADCSSGSCEDGVCEENPEIESISPTDGAVGTYVTISGSGFGSLEGTVVFTGATSGTTVEAEVLDCGDGDGWADDEIVVAVPDGAGDGPITITTSSDATDSTDDEDGQLVESFDVNEVEHPGLCTLSPSNGEPNDAFSLAGVNFGSSQGESSVMVGAQEAGSYTSWASGEIDATVPSLEDGAYAITVVVDGETSNALSFDVASDDENAVITEVSPSEGGIGQYVTITGSEFGASTGTVIFENASTGETAIGSIDFPSECSEDIWSITEVTIIVPDEFNDEDGTALSTGEYNVTVRTSRGVVSNESTFMVTDADPTPGICALDPSSGDIGDTVTIYGDNFGSSGSVAFYSEAGATASTWANDEITVTVPVDALSGPVAVTSADGTEGNTSTFTVGESSGTASTVAAAYAWSFSTGEILETPEVVQACNATQVSAVPNGRFSDASEVCVNAVVYAEFTTLMDEASVQDAVTVSKCTSNNDDPCDTLEEVSGVATAASGASFSSVTWVPTADFDVSSTYQVTIDTTARSSDGITLGADVTWEFATRTSTDACVIEDVIVSPSIESITELHATAGFAALPVTGCVVTDSSDYTWDWSLDTYSYADFDATSDDECTGDPTACATVEALAEGVVAVNAAAAGTDAVGTSSLTINFTDPYITDYQPDCTEACLNAQIGASFNTAMTAADITDQNNISLYRCANELCTDLTLFSSAIPECVLEDSDDDGDIDDCTGFTFDGMTLTASTFYRVIVSGGVTSTSGVPLIRTNYGDAFSWTFRAREDSSLCTVERLDISPSTITVNEVGAQTPFTAMAYGESDSCSTSGQLLSGSDFNWSWTDPIADNPEDDDEYSVAAWFTDASGSLIDSDATSIPEGCTSLCTAAGSEPDQAVCGDGTLDQDEETLAGEDCDDGNTVDNDGCSSSCKYEGTDASAEGVSGCGDLVIDEFEDCDDGNVVDGDGCSSTCLAEGSRSVGAMCGNNDIAYNTTTFAGEECDDGNAMSGDGCSRECLREGSSTRAEIGDAECGDGETTEPYETCDDGNTTNGDGCSSMCLREGSYSASSCGNGVTEYSATTYAGEECDGEVGCTDECIWGGSSAGYSAPSFCGDGTFGAGELAACENGASGDGYIDDTQISEVSQDASYEVSTATGLAAATIEVSTSGLTVSADLTLMCIAENDQDCSDPTTHGVGAANCCYERPETVSLAPKGADACLNATVYATFTDEMDVSSFTSTETSGTTTVDRAQMYVKLNLASGQSCPSSHTTIAQAPSSFALRIWNAMKSVFIGTNVSADQGDCILPIASYSQTAQDDGTYKVAIRTTKLMEAGSLYTLVIEGDDDITDEASAGVRSLRDVGMNGTVSQDFTTGTTICTLDALEVTDGDSDSPYYFSSTDETHEFSVAALSHSTGSAQEISPIPGSYDWTYSDWSVSDEVVLSAAAISSSLPDEAAVVALGENGDATVAITATVTEGGDESVSGTANVTAYLCENPWPTLMSYPWSDDATGEANGLATAGTNGYMNFSTGYCRDAGTDGEDDDLSSVTVVQPPSFGGSNVIKEYLFEMGDGSGDAIGVRIASNTSYLSPAAWYEAQGFTGSPTETTVDGFPAVEDGRTVYIGAPNDSSGSIYPNMYVISYNEGASESTIDVYEMMLENMSFAINIDDDRYCYAGGAIVADADGDAKTCSSDLNCDVSAAEECGSDKLKIMRDIERLGELNDIASLIEAYGEENGTCSDTTSQSCTEDSDCTGDETCEPLVPTLPSGTYVASLASSTWSSWSEIFGGALDESNLAADPLNAYSYCGVTSSLFASYDDTTCVNQTTGAYVCPEDSYAYHYRSIGSRAYELNAALEYDGGAWKGDVDADTSDDYEINAGLSGTSDSLCDGDVYGASTTCGDGIVGGSERCEVGDTQGASCDVDSGLDSDGDGNKTNDTDGTINQVCKSDCSDYEDVSGATCEANECGDGVVAGTEQCDDGTYNGQYGYCGTSCTYASGSYCGDGEVSGSEACDCGDTSVAAAGRPYGGASGDCAYTNGTYGGNPNTTCAWDCSGPASYCGDADVNEDQGEECDGEAGSWDGKLCIIDPSSSSSSSGVRVNTYQPCESDSDCLSYEMCGDSVDDGSVADACPVSTICTAGDVGAVCDVDGDCDSTSGAGDGVCSNQTYATTRTIACEDDGSIGQTCGYAATWASTECYGTGNCGDGAVDAGEECDDGNADNTDSCSNECTANVCGDGYLYEGEEQCDEGTGNGAGCEAAYGSSCSGCSVSCTYESSSGSFCGDGELNGDEFCDGNDMPYYYISSSLFSSGVDEDAEISGACTPGSSAIVDDNDTPTDSSDDVLYICSNVGMCSGGTDNGDYCTANSDCDSSDCVFPTCDADCASSCPFTTENASLEITTNEAGADPESSALLYSFSTASDSDIPNAATLTIPSCSAATELLADVSYDGVTQPEVYVVFVTDVSGSMGSTLGSSTRMEVAKASIIEAIESLFDEVDSVEIALVKYSSSVATYSDDNDTTDTADDITWFGSAYQGDLETAVTAYSYGGQTYTSSGLDAAEALLDAKSVTSTNYRKIIVHLSDGEPSSGYSPAQSVASILYNDTTSSENDAYEMYSMALTSSTTLVSSMNTWSSNSTVSDYTETTSTLTSYDYNQSNYLDYSYSGSTTEELEDGYAEIINSIIFGTAMVISTDDQGTTDTSDDVTYVTRDVLEEGSSVSLPWPEGFTCSTSGETELPLQITFAGIGQIEISSPSINYCAP